MGAWRYGSIEVWEHGDMGASRYGSMEIWEHTLSHCVINRGRNMLNSKGLINSS